MVNSLYSFADVEAKKATPATVSIIIKDVLRANEGECYSEIERYLMPPGFSGSRSFDQAYAVSKLLEFDAAEGGRLATIMESTGMSRRILWDKLQGVLRGVGFKMQHGRLVGVLENKSDEPDNSGQPDID